MGCTKMSLFNYSSEDVNKKKAVALVSSRCPVLNAFCKNVAHISLKILEIPINSLVKNGEKDGAPPRLYLKLFRAILISDKFFAESIDPSRLVK